MIPARLWHYSVDNMVKKKSKKSKTKKVKKEVPKPEPETLSIEIPEDINEPEVKEEPKDKGGKLKTFAILILVIGAVAFIYYFLTLSENMFVAGPGVNETEFKDVFADANYIYIVMDIRGVQNPGTKQNILQCGVDFAGSTGMIGKTATYFSLDDEGCVTPEGFFDYKYCFSQLSNGVTIYVKEGSETTFHSNGMVVGISPDYSLGLCGIHRV